MDRGEALHRLSISVSSGLEETLDACLSILDEYGLDPDSDYDTHVAVCTIIHEIRSQLNEIEEDVLNIDKNKL